MENNFTRYSNIVVPMRNYSKCALENCLEEYGDMGYQLASTQMIENAYRTKEMYLFFTREEKD